MFSNCYKLHDITALANWDVSNVKDMKDMFSYCEQLDISGDPDEIKSYFCNFPKPSYPNYHKQDHTSLLNSLWERVKPLLKDTTKLNGYFKRYTISEPINDAVKSNETETSVKDDTIEQHDDIPKPNTLTVDLPSDWQNIELIQWNP
jgi:surface protein